jgi:hypothetical protein
MFFSPISDLLSVCLVTSILVLFSFFHKLSDDFLVRELVSFKKKKEVFSPVWPFSFLRQHFVN